VRAIIVCLLFSGFGLAMAQDSAPPPASDNAAASAGAPADSPAAWLTQPVFGGAAGPVAGHYRAPGRMEFTGRPTGVCSVRLLEMPIPKDVWFTVREFHPRPTGDRLWAQVPAPPCP